MFFKKEFIQGLQNTPKLGARSKSGYILFSAVVRKKIMNENPECPFGVISKLVGAEVNPLFLCFNLNFFFNSLHFCRKVLKFQNFVVCFSKVSNFCCCFLEV